MKLEFDPLARLLVNQLSRAGLPPPAPGQARLELNIVLREFSAAFGMFFISVVLAVASERVESERRRDTWSGLLATPLTGAEIVRAKILAAYRMGLPPVLFLAGLWIVGVLAGAVHPLGLVAGLAGLVILGALYSALGLVLGLAPPQLVDTLNPFYLLLQVVAALGIPVVLICLPAMLLWTGLVSYEDVDALIRGGRYVRWQADPRLVLGCWLIATIVASMAAARMVRRLVREFDRIVGRPVRPDEPA